ncbi:MAG: polysaccharide ABC transporter ATP-binding protein [Acidobacteriota bacterium]
MGNSVIRVENLGKIYRIGERERYKALRDSITNFIYSPFRRLQPMVKSSNVQTSKRSKNNFIWALKDVSFEVKQGEVIGIIGRNGAGKTTLLKILSRITEPTEGYAEVRGRVGSLLEVGTGFHPELTGRENIYLNGAILGMRKTEIDKKFDEIVDFAEVEKFIDTPVKYYSSGMYVRLAFAVAAHLEPEILLVDEVLAVGDAAFQKKCLGKMGDVAKEGRTVLFVSHNMAAIQGLCSKAIWLEEGSVKLIDLTHSVLEAYREAILHSVERAYPPGILFDTELADIDISNSDFAITRVLILDEKGCRKPVLRTWDYVRFRIFFQSNKYLDGGGVDLEFTTLESIPVLYSASAPFANLTIAFTEGKDGWVDCVFPRFPLAAGLYLVRGALTVPGLRYLWRMELATLDVTPADVYGTGHTPTNTYTLIAPDCFWEQLG